MNTAEQLFYYSIKDFQNNIIIFVFIITNNVCEIPNIIKNKIV